MRIVAGDFRGRKLLPPKGMNIRPTADRVREALFSMIASHIRGARVLDLFAGTGALGLEALSRGAEAAVFVDQDLDAVRIIRANVGACRVQDRVRIFQAGVEQAIRRLGEERFHLIFMDPPYGKGHIERTLPGVGDLAHPEALVVAEHSVKDHLPGRMGPWTRVRERRYGDTMISLFVMDLPADVNTEDSSES